MVFLNPAFLFGLIAASIPVLIHLLNLKKLKRVEFSTLAFIKELQKSKIRRIKLKQWLLLALRVLIILLLVTGFARPTLEGLTIGGSTSAAKTSAVFILDDTFSMSLIDQRGSYFNQAKQTIKLLAAQLQQGDDLTLLLVSNRSGEIPQTFSSISEFIIQLEATKLSYSSGYLHNSIVKAAKIMESSQNFNKEIYLFSDFQKGRLAEKNSLSDLSQVLNDKIRLYVFNYEGKGSFNLGIESFEIKTRIFEPEKPVMFETRIVNYSSRQIDNRVISLYIDGERVSQKSLSLSPGGSALLELEAALKKTGHISAMVEIEDDEILFDNKRFNNFFISEKINLLLLSQTDSDPRFVRLALASADENSQIKIIEKKLNQISTTNLNDYDVVILIGVQGISSTQAVKEFLNSGKGIIIFPSAGSGISEFNTFFPFISLPALSGTAGKMNETLRRINFDKVEFNHPIFSGLFTSKEKNKIESPDIYFHFKLFPTSGSSNIISLIGGSSFLSEFKSGQGKILFYSVAPDLSWSNFPLKSIFVPLVYKSVYYLSVRNRTSSVFTAGDGIMMNPELKTLAKVKIIRPDNQEITISGNDLTTRQLLLPAETSVAGNYRVVSNEKLMEIISVNPDPLESSADYLNEKVFSDYLDEIKFKGKLVKIDADENSVQKVLQARFGSELWKYFILTALVIALIEMLIARNNKKEVDGLMS
jgi:hypothetical protein